MPHQLDLFSRALDIPSASEDPSPNEHASARGEVIVAAGPRATQALLFEWIEARLSEAERDPTLLAQPVRVLVPSRSLRLDVSAALAAKRGRAAAGVVVQTLFGAAVEVLAAAGEGVPAAGGTLFEILARRAARNEPSLASGLSEFADGYATAVGSIRDLLDAGLDPTLADAVDEVLANEGPRAAPRLAVERARALARAGAATSGWISALGHARPNDLFRRASELLAVDVAQSQPWPHRAIAIHGFADATGVASDLLEVLVARRGAVAFLDHPETPEGSEVSNGHCGRERAFAARLTQRLAGGEGGPTHEKTVALDPPHVAAFSAAGTDGEIREVLLRIRALLDLGERPERIGLVARDLEPYRLTIRRHAARLGIAFSGLGARGALTPAGARIAALQDLLEQGEVLPTSRWLDALASVRLSTGRMPRPGFDFRLALAALGAGRLRDAAELDLTGRLRDGRYPLPIRHGLFTQDDAPDDGAEETQFSTQGATQRANEEPNEEPIDDAKPMSARAKSRVPRRTVSGQGLAALLASARRIQRGFEQWPERAKVSEHLRLLLALVRDELGWPSGAAATAGTAEMTDLARAVQSLVDLADELPADLVLERAEIAPLVRRALLDHGRTVLGGAGGGVQVLGVVEGRARTFDHLFVVGLNRDTFPRPIHEDPLLPDSLRRTLATVLPDVPQKRSGFDEERYLFAQMLAASPAITLSWQSTDDEGRVRPASPLVERFRLGGASVLRAPGVWNLGAGTTRGAALVRPAWERAITAALASSRARYAEALESALAEAAAELDLPPSVAPSDLFAIHSIARGRIAALDEHDPDFKTPEGRARARTIGPFLGFLGPRTVGEPELPITHLERLVGCPWQYFLGRVLRLEPTPDPLQALPGIDARWIGNLVHAVLDRFTRREGEPHEAAELGSLSERLSKGWRPEAEPAWPDPEELERLLALEAKSLVEEEGLPLSGLGRALAERARPYLEIARAAIIEGENAGWSFVASEAKGEVVGGGGRLTFRADRVDVAADGELVLTDWKTGKPLSDKKRPDGRRADQLQRARQGTQLQAAVYARAAGRGRYLYVRPEAESREFAVHSGDVEHAEALDQAAAAGFGARDQGSFFPRLVDSQGEKEPARCRYCEVSEACIRGDSGARRRIFEWSRDESNGGNDRNVERRGAEDAALAVWRLGK